MSNQRLVPLNVAALASAPAGTPKIGDLYYNTTNLKTWVYSSGGWVVAAGGGAAFQTSAPTGPQVGDIWVDSDAAINLLTPDDYALLSGPTFTGPSTVAVNSASTAFTIKQTGAGNAFVVEDSASPDSTPFVVTADGNVGIGTSTPAKLLDVNGDALVSGLTVGKGAISDVTDTIVGYEALNNGAPGTQNTALGYTALKANTANYGTAVGANALQANTTGEGNTAVGRLALFLNTTGAGNTAVGLNALAANTTGNSNTANGLQALYSNTTGNYNTANGLQALVFNTTGNYNTANGVSALVFNTTGNYNTANGVSALYSNTTGNYNTANGLQAGYGTGANANTTGSNNTFIGNESVGASATASNVITLGNSAIATLRCQVTTITALSDARDKAHIEPIPAGLDFVNRLSPVAFDWNTRDGAKVGIADMGFIAQDLLQVMEDTGIEVPNLVSQENPDRLEAGYGTLIPVLVQAIKELSAQVKQLQEAAHA